MAKDFLHNIDLNELQKEVGIDSVEGIGTFLEMKNPKGPYNWAKDGATYGTRPSYNDIIRLLRRGATTETLFGVSCEPKQSAPAGPSPEFLKAHPELLEGMREQLVEDLMKKDLVPKDQVKDIVRQEIERLFPSAKPAIVDLKTKGLI